MINLNDSLQDEICSTLIFQDSQNKYEIQHLLQSQKFNYNLALKLLLKDERAKMQFVGECLSEAVHLRRLDIFFQNSFFIQEGAIGFIFRPLKSFINLKILQFKLSDKLKLFNFNDLMELFDSIGDLPQLEVISITLPFIGNKQKRKELITPTLKSLKSLKQLRLNVMIQDSNEQQCLNEFLPLINLITSLTYLSFQIKHNPNPSYQKELDLKFDNLVNLQELHIISNQSCQFQIERINEQLKKLNSLIRLKIQITILNNHDQLRLLFNTVLLMQELEEFTIYLDIQDKSEVCVKIGDRVCSNSSLKVFNYSNSNGQQIYKKGSIVIGMDILKIKNLEKLSLHFGSYQIEQETLDVLNKWTHEWTKVTELSVQYGFMLNLNQSMQICLTNGLVHLKQVRKLNLNMCFSHQAEKKNILDGLMELEHLETFNCISLYGDTYQNINEQQYIKCFSKLSNLRELSYKIITKNNEILCIGHSFRYLSNLVSLSINFGIVFYHSQQDLEFFFKNLMKFENLRSLLISSLTIFKINEDFFKTSDAKNLLQSISTLKSLRSLNLALSKSMNFSLEMFSNEFWKFIKDLEQLNILTFNWASHLKTRLNIIRHQKRLVQLSAF